MRKRAVFLSLLFAVTAHHAAAANAPSRTAIVDALEECVCNPRTASVADSGTPSPREALLDHVRRLIAQGADVNAATARGRTPLMLAVQRPGQDDLVALLLASGADVHLQDNEGQTALMLSARRADPHIVEMLLEKGGQRDAEGRTASDALVSFIVDVVQIGARGAERDEQVGRALRCIRLLVRYGVPFDLPDADGGTPLLYAAIHDRTEIMAELLAMGADANATSRWGATPLVEAALSGSPEAVRLLLVHGARADVEGVDGFRRRILPLLAAIEAGSEPSALLLLDATPAALLDARLAPRAGHIPEAHTALGDAIDNGMEELVRRLLDMGARVDVPGDGTRLPLAMAVRRGDQTIVKLLTDHGAVSGSAPPH